MEIIEEVSVMHKLQVLCVRICERIGMSVCDMLTCLFVVYVNVSV